MADPVIAAETPDALAERAAADFLSLVTKTLESQERFSVALAGGVTPKLFYACLAKEPYKSKIPWSKIWVFFGDERCVPPDHADSNFRMASEILLQYVPVHPSHVARMRGEDPPPVAAQEYEKFMRSFFREGGPWPRLDLILLGLGLDGHTASLMPGTPAVEHHVSENFVERRETHSNVEADPLPRWVVHNVVRTLQTVRLTLTFPVINHAKHIWFLVTGAKKAAAYAEVRKAPNPAFPASLVQAVDGQVCWYIDKSVLQKEDVCPTSKSKP